VAAFFTAHALLPSGWALDVRIDVDPGGSIVAVSQGATPDGVERLRGAALPGLCDLHCHAFQRAMAGLTERRASGDDSFWTWREVMYAFVARLAPDDVEAIGAQLYVELLKGGFTSVCEFHYLHNDPAGRPYANPAEMSERLLAAAATAGIGLTLLPVLYTSSDFGGAPPQPAQRRFTATPERIVTLIERLSRANAGPNVRLGLAPHSLRAVTPDALDDALRALDAIDRDAPIHIHAAEQVKEVEDCLAWSSKRPVEWLLHHHRLSPRWCVVHATHMTDAETDALAASGAAAGLCPTTEANLGDGLFPLGRYLERGGSFGVGSDSNVSVSAVEELRWLEYGQRLVHRRRSVAASPSSPSVGSALFGKALAGGAKASGRPVAGIAPGQRADLLVLESDSASLAGKTGDTLLDAFIFAGSTNPIRDVFVGGKRVIADGRHAAEASIRDTYRRTLTRLLAG
jgi:formimidoylglutamate deiminase